MKHETPAGEGVFLDAAAARILLSGWGVRFAPWALATSAAEAAREAETLGWPVALKIAGGDVVHKSDIGGVALNLADRESVAHAYDVVSAAAASAGSARPGDVIVERMMTGGTEMIVGLQRDPTFGPVVLVGLGGIWVETMRDIALRLCPVEPDEAVLMVKELRGLPLLAGGRGRPPCDLPALGALVASISRLGARRDDIAELDLNPVMALPDGLVAVDARIRLVRPREHAP